MILHKPGTSLLAFYISAALWNLCMGMLQVLLPLYALSLGFSILKISSIVALPVLAEIVIRLLSSAFSDRFGERRIIQACYLMMMMSGLLLLTAESYGGLLLAQAVAYFSRSTFWISVQSLASQLPGSSLGKRLGQLLACNYAGNLIGLSLGGIVAALLGYPGSFLLLIALALTCSLLGLALPHVEPKPSGRTVWGITHGIGRFLHYRHIWLAISVSYAAALPPSLTQSIYPLYLAYLNYAEQWIGVTISFRALGPILTGLMFGSFVTPARQIGIYATGMAVLGVSLVSSGLAEQPFFLVLCIAALGAAGGIMDLLYQVQASEFSGAGDRTVTMASMGLGWNLSPFLTPILLGWLAEVQGFQFAFLAAGLFFLLIAVGTRLWHRLLAP
jgi:MFS family permease